MYFSDMNYFAAADVSLYIDAPVLVDTHLNCLPDILQSRSNRADTEAFTVPVVCSRINISG